MADKELHEEIGDLRRQFNRLNKDINQLMETGGDEVRHWLGKTQQNLKGKTDEVAKQSKELASQTNKYVEDHPWQTAGVATAVGFLLGVLLSRRK